MPDHRDGTRPEDLDRQTDEAQKPAEEKRNRDHDLKGQDREGGSGSPSADIYRDVPGDRVGG